MSSNSLIPFSFENQSFRVVDKAGEPWFILPDVCSVLEVNNSRDAAARLDEDEKGVATVDTLGGRQNVTIINESGLWSLVLTSRKAAAKRLKKWVTAEVLPSIRKTGGYSTEQFRRNVRTPRVDVAREHRLAMGQNLKIAKMIGLIGNQAVMSANRATAALTGIDTLNLLGVSHMDAPQQEALLTPTDLGQRIGRSAREVNLILCEIGYQTMGRDLKGHIYYEPTVEGVEAGGVMQDTGKKHSTGTPIRQLRWASSVAERIREREMIQ